jgi:hypothetical protein
MYTNQWYGGTTLPFKAADVKKPSIKIHMVKTKKNMFLYIIGI